MASITTYSFSQLVQNFTAAAQASAKVLLDFTVGSIDLAFAEACSAVALWLQALVLQVLGLTRAATSNGADLDSWMADWNFFRLPAVAATGSVTFSRANTSIAATIPLGTIVQTSDGTETFATTAAATIPSGTASVTVTVQAQMAGTGGNVAAGSITTIAQPIVSVDTVTNGAAFTNGVDAESDAAFRARFPIYLAGLVGATEAAIQSAIVDVQQGLFYDLLENENSSGQTLLGAFTAVVDDGSGAPPSTLLASVMNAVDAARGFTIQPYVTGPTKIVPAIALAIRVASGYTQSTVEAAVQTAVVAAVNAIEPVAGGTYLYISLVEQAALSVAGVVAVQPGATTINGSAADLALTAFQVPRIGAPNVTVGSY